MNKLLKKYKAFFIGTILTVLAFALLENIGFLRVEGVSAIEYISVQTAWALGVSLIIHFFPAMKRKAVKHPVFLFKALGLVGFFIALLAIDSYMRSPDNPLTIALLIAFWLGVFHTLFPSFVNRYRYLIFGMYAFGLLYFTYVRLFSESFELYIEQEKGLAFTFFLLPIPVMALLWVYEQWKWFQALKADKAQAELALLKSQVNPHFFFNTLNNLYSLTVQKSDKAPEVILKLSEMMRYTIYEGKNDFVPLKNEIDYLENYIELHKIRYHKSVDILFEHSADGDFPIAPLLFINLLENAFKHGLEKLRKEAYIHIRLTTTDKKLSFCIENNFDPEEGNPPQGIGLDNLRRRLELIYPKSHRFVTEKIPPVFKAEIEIELP